ncbi:mechanosensitive ion channel family protein [Balneolales bacterium ANBcel1]|nr:mechanosensitive ion channel family protein [Balneolales bacterium ANBcel1]
MEQSGTSLIRWVTDLLPESWHFSGIETLIGILLLLVLVAFLHLIVRGWLLKLFQKLSRTARNPWYDALLQNRLPQRALFLLPLLIFYIGFEWVSDLPEELLEFFMRMINAVMILVIARSSDSFLSAIHTLHLQKEESHRRPIKSYIQLGKVLIYLISAILIIAQLAGQSPWYFLSGIGAMTAIFMLVFRDTLLSLVASVQLTNNDLVRVGDWIEMQQFGADGDVIDIALNSVRVQNWDKTYAIIPTHKFLEHSFRNWRGMQESGGRRMMRSLLIDIESIRFLTLPEVERLKESYLLRKYITDKLEDVHKYNQQNLTSPGSITNGRWLTNIGTFRAYAFAYLKHHPLINKELFTLVRQLEPTPNGLPLQLYGFTKSTQWGDYEQVQADIFDHMLAIMPEFGLRHYQHPSGWDFGKIHSGNRSDGAH